MAQSAPAYTFAITPVPIPPLRRWGYIPDLVDRRDKMFTERPGRWRQSASKLWGERFDLRHLTPPIDDQGTTAHCSAYAVVAAVRAAWAVTSLKPVPLRVGMLYSSARISMGWPAVHHEGVGIRACLKQLAPDMAYYRLDDTEDHMIRCLGEGYPFVFGFTAYESFPLVTTLFSGILPEPEGEREKALGGHAMLCVGWDPTTRCFLVRNSFGERWGNRGHAWMPYGMMTIDAQDCWTVRVRPQ